MQNHDSDTIRRLVLTGFLAFAATPAIAASWSLAATPGAARMNGSATLLGDGRVLVVGGYNIFTCQGTAEIYNPSTNTWSGTGAPATPRCGSPLLRLGNGKVLVVGGTATTTPAAEIYDPATAAWSATGNQPPMREAPAAAFVTATTVLVTGGNASGSTIPAWLYDSATNQWNEASPPLRTRSHHTATQLYDGAAMVVGGEMRDGNATVTHDSIEHYSSGSFADGLPLHNARTDHLAVRLASGAVLVVGGRRWVCSGSSCGTQVVTSAEIYAPSAGWTWAATPTLRYHVGAKATLLTDGRVLFVGGYAADGSYDDTEIYDPASNTWTAGPVLTYQRIAPTATLLADGRVLVSGGTSAVPAEIFNP
jgi:hypothetical protein